MKTIRTSIITTVAMALLAGNALAVTFESGSTCGTAFAVGDTSPCLGAYTAPSVSSTITLPANGILDYTTFTVPTGYTVRFTKNVANTPVIIRTSGDVTIAGAIGVSAGTGVSIVPTSSGTAGDGNVGDDGQPGTGGPGGFDGGRGGLSPVFGGATWQLGGEGKGPGGGASGGYYAGSYPTSGLSGGSGGFGTVGGSISNANINGTGGGVGGATYGQASLLPLIGGSGGGGGAAGLSFNGAGGGGGGGAIMIASSGNINFTGGTMNANGSAGGDSSGSNSGGGGGGGSGGGIRLVANSISRTTGQCNAIGGATGSGNWAAGSGGSGRIRFESNATPGWTTGNTVPAYTWGLPGHVFVPNNPTLTIVSVTPTAGLDNMILKTAPANPTGNADITFQTGTTTATVILQATNIPAGTVADVHVIPALGAARTKTLSTAFTGGLAATAAVTLSPGNNILQAAVTYTVTEVVAMNLPTFDNGERVAKIRVEGGMDGKSQVIYITASGKEYPAVKAKG